MLCIEMNFKVKNGQSFPNLCSSQHTVMKFEKMIQHYTESELFQRMLIGKYTSPETMAWMFFGAPFL